MDVMLEPLADGDGTPVLVVDFLRFAAARTLGAVLAGASGDHPLWRADPVEDLTREPGYRTVPDLADAYVRRGCHGSGRPRSATGRRCAAEAGLPLVVKPSDGVSGRDIWLIQDDRELDRFLHEARAGEADGGLPGGMYAEQYLTGDEPPARHLADYVSVEVFVTGREAGATFVTDRLVPERPCREIGLVLPTSLGPARQAAVTDCAVRAVRALGVRDGAYHVEVKTRAGRTDVIEVNGRLGGFVARLADGYLDGPEATRRRFVRRDTPDGPRDCYRTGDRARRRADGVLEFLGRDDAQVKLRGHRIELGAVEAALEEHPDVVEAAVILRDTERPDRTYIAAYVVTGTVAVPQRTLRSWLAERLPAAARPARILSRTALPRTAAGKVDRMRLAADPAENGA